MLKLASVGDVRQVGTERPRSDPDSITIRQREKIRAAILARAELLQHRAGMIVVGAQAVDPESAVSSVESLRRLCDAILADVKHALRS